MKSLKYIATIMFMTLIVACSHEIETADILNNEKEFDLNIYPNDRFTSQYDFKKVFKKSINKDSEIFLKMKNWLKKNHDNWQNSFVSYATPDISLIGNKFRLLIFKDFVVIGFTDKDGKVHLCTKKVNKSEFDFLIVN